MMTGIINSSQASWNGYALVTAKPVAVTFLSDVQVADDEDKRDFFYGDLFEATLTNIQVIYGSLDVQRLTVELTATHREVLANKNEIFLLLDLRDEKPRVVHWGVPRSIACIPRKFLEGKGISDDFMIEDHRLERLCTNAEWFQ